jgi:STE24 endopeptidase
MVSLTGNAIFYAVLAFSWVEYLWSAYLGRRQRAIYRKHTSVPSELNGIIDASTFEKARLYALDKAMFGAVEGVFSQVLSSVLMWFYGFKIVWDLSGESTQEEIYRSLLFVFYFNIFNVVIGTPFSIYNTFVLEERHGFNKQTVPFFVKDQIKKFFVSQIIMLPLVAAIIKIIHWGGDYFFIYLWGFVLIFTVFMMVVYPEFIAPLFDKYTPLPEGDLRGKIEELASSIDFPLYKLFVVEGSKRSSHSNAYFYGFFKFKRIVLFDTLLEESEREKLKTEEDKEADEKKVKEMNDDDKKKREEEKKKGCSTPEILAVLAHELGHWSLNHVLKNILISEVHIFLMFALFGYLYHMQLLYTAFGFPDERPVLIGLMIILQFITAPYNAVLDFLMTCLTRKFEFEADAFAAKMGKAAELKTALVKLNNDNLSFPIYDWLYSAWHHSHPPLLERMAAIDDKKEK